MSATCRSCGEAVIWAVTQSGKKMPLDAVPDDLGGVAVHRDEAGAMHVRVLQAGDKAAPWEKRGTSHFETCPNADQHRKKVPKAGWGQ